MLAYDWTARGPACGKLDISFGHDLCSTFAKAVIAVNAAGAVVAGPKEKDVLIFDLGGGTFDVSLLTIEEGIFKV